MSRCTGVVIRTGKIRRTQRKKPPSASSSTTNSTGTGLALIPALCSDRPAIKSLSHGKALWILQNQNLIAVLTTACDCHCHAVAGGSLTWHAQGYGSWRATLVGHLKGRNRLGDTGIYGATVKWSLEWQQAWIGFNWGHTTGRLLCTSERHFKQHLTLNLATNLFRIN